MVRAAPLVLALLVLSGCSGGDADPAGGELAITVNRAGWNEIWLMASDGSDRRRLTEAEPAGNDAAGSAGPAWSPDGKQIAFAAQIGTLEEDPGGSEIYVMDADGSGRRQLTTNDAPDGTPGWSPDGEWIAFARVEEPGTATARGGIFLVDADGGPELQLTSVRLPSLDWSPVWSPDGSEIVFVRSTGRGGSTGTSGVALYTVPSGGGAPRKLADDGTEPAWSPDGERIAFTSSRDGFGRTCFHECGPSPEIYALELANGETTRLTESEASDAAPAWSPDGRLLAFVSDRSDPNAHEYEIYVMSPSGDGLRRVTQNDVWDEEPAWRP